MAVGHIGSFRLFPFFSVFFLLALTQPVGGVEIHQQAALPVSTDGKVQAVQPGKACGIVPAQAQSRCQQANDTAFCGFPVRFAGLKFGIRTPRLQGRGQPKQQRCHGHTSFPGSFSFTARSSAVSIWFRGMAGASSSSPMPTAKLWAGASA